MKKYKVQIDYVSLSRQTRYPSDEDVFEHPGSLIEACNCYVREAMKEDDRLTSQNVVGARVYEAEDYYGSNKELLSVDFRGKKLEMSVDVESFWVSLK